MQNKTASETLWVKFGKTLDLCCVGRDVLCLGLGCHLIFFHVPTRTEIVYRANSHRTGDGIACYNGHRNLPIMAFAEMCRNPRIIVMAYPSFAQISNLPNGSPGGYIEVAFAEAEYLVALSSLPHFSVIVWAWRSGEKLAVKDSKVIFENQMLKYSTTTTFAQIAVNQRIVKVWDLHVCSKQCMLSYVDIKMPKAKEGLIGLLWTPESEILLLDCLANVYMVPPDGTEAEMIIKWNGGTGSYKPCFTYYKSGVAIACPTKEIVLRQRNGSNWPVICHICPLFGLIKLISMSAKDLLIGWSSRGHVQECDISHPSTELQFTVIKRFETGYIDFSMVYPCSDYFATLNADNELSTWELVTGEHVACLPLLAKTISMRCCPKYPILALGRTDGNLLFISVYNVTEPTPIQNIHLMDKPIQGLVFSDSGQFLVAGYNTGGIYFLLKGQPGLGWNVLTHFDAHAQVADFIMIEAVTALRFIILKVTSTQYIIGNKLTMYTFPANAREEKVLCQKVNLDLIAMYAALNPCLSKPPEEGIFYGVPHMSRDMHVLQLREKSAKILSVISSGHQMRLFRVNMDHAYLLTFGVDGLIMIYDRDYLEGFGVILPHHRRLGGVAKARIDPFREHVISLSRQSNLVCTHLLNSDSDITQRRNLRKSMISPEMMEMFGMMCTTHLREFDPNKPASCDILRPIAESPISLLRLAMESTPTFLDMEREHQILVDAMKCAVPRQEILKELQELRERLCEMINKNEKNPEEEQLPINVFNLDQEWIEVRSNQTQAECDKIKAYLEGMIKAQDKVTNYVKGRCWDQMNVKPKSMRAIFANYEVENYGLIPADQQDANTVTILKERRRIESLLSKDDVFMPWLPTEPSVLDQLLQRPPSINAEDEAARILEAMAKDEAADVAGAELTAVEFDENNRLMYGTTTHIYIDTTYLPRYTQFEVNTFLQASYEKEAKRYYNLQLRHYFNKLFSDCVALKAREIQLVTERNARFRHILSELHNNEITINDPEIRLTENPEKIVVVDDNEVQATPYISPSLQAILDAQAAEAERIRLLLLADDFRERALMYMMDGVLEIRWEDEIKKDVPKPKCMLEKDPKDFTEEDLRAIYEYEEKVQFLMSERERYRKMLEAEYTKLCGNYRDSIKKFNTRLTDLSLLKLKVESSMLQERFKIARNRQVHYERILGMIADKVKVKAITDNDAYIEQYQRDLSTLNMALADCKAALEVLINKDKLLDKNYKREFPDASPVLLEQYYKLFRKRPRLQVKSVSPSLFYELAKCIESGEQPMFLPAESAEYMRALDTLNTMAGVPATIDEANYATLIRIRHVKIAAELRIKGMGFELAEAEATIAFFVKTLVTKRENRDKLIAQLNEHRDCETLRNQDVFIQLVIKQGFVEIPLSGEMKAFDDAVLINRTKVEEMNNIINNCGNRKLKAMHAAMNFRRGILAMEWQHRHMVMEIEDLEEYVRTVQRIDVSRDVMTYLKLRATGESIDKGILSLDKEVELIREQYLKMITERQAAVDDLEERISAKKKDSAQLDYKIIKLNVDVCEKELARNKEFEVAHDEAVKTRMQCLVKRSRLIKTIQEQYNEILILQTELELLRLKTYPTLKYNPFH